MAINPEHVGLYEHFFIELKSVLPRHAETLIIGHQDILPGARNTFPFDNVRQLFHSYGWNATDLDLHDKRAIIHADLNLRLEYRSKFDLVFDIGTLEHISNSHQALENYLTLLRPGGWLFLLTPIRGYYQHGFHTFAEEYLKETLLQNGCAIKEIVYLLPEWCGIPSCIINHPNGYPDVLIVILASLVEVFNPPLKAVQQKAWVK
jgi:SAM-dependent methyltransferase